MRLTKIRLIAVLLFLIAMFAGCHLNNPNLASINIGGEWEGNILMEGDGNEATADSSYFLSIVQDNSSLTASLSIPAEFGINSPIILSGELNVDSTLTMAGTGNDSGIKVYGTAEDEYSLQIVITGTGINNQFVFLHKEDTLATASFTNQYKLNLKLGQSGIGRSVILVHGMDDNADSWNTMLSYLENHGIATTNDVWVFEYKWWKHISDNASEMLTMVQDLQNTGKISQEPIIIAHSMGGLVSRKYIADGGTFYRLVTLSTPHLGSNLAHFVPFGDEDGIGDLLPDHGFLDSLNSDAHETSQRSKYWLLDGRVGTYPSCYDLFDHPWCYHWHSPTPTHIEKIGHAKLHKPNDGMVTNASARFDGDNSVHRIDTFEWIDHKRMNQDERICEWVTNFIKDHQ